MEEISTRTNPLEGRQFYRQDLHFQCSTFGLYRGKLQLNMAMLPSSVSEDFYRFCQLNESACPVVFHSQPGDFTAEPLAKDSDIRTDLAAYRVYKNGELTDTKANVKYHDWTQMVSFYLGCSFSFDGILMESGILKINAENKNVPMYITDIPCIPVNMFSAPLVVSMRQILKDQLLVVFETTMDLDFCHGAPIHIGNPQDIGIPDVKKVAFGYSPINPLSDNEVYVFWACGVTSSMAIKSAKLPVCFSHSPGCMFVSDVDTKDAHKLFKNSIEYPKPFVVCLNEKLARYTVISQSAWNSINKIGHSISCKDYIFGNVILNLTRCKRIKVHSSYSCGLDLSLLLYLVQPLLGLGIHVQIHLDKYDANLTSLKSFYEKEISENTIGLLFNSNQMDSVCDEMTFSVGGDITINAEPTDAIVIIGNRCDDTNTVDIRQKAIAAIIFGLFVASSCPIHERYRRYGLGQRSTISLPDLLPTREKILRSFNSMDDVFIDGIDNMLQRHIRNYDELTN